MSLEGSQVGSDLWNQLWRQLADKNPPSSGELMNVIMPIASLTQPRNKLVKMYKTSTTDVFLQAPPGRVWEVKKAVMAVTADANPANRAVTAHVFIFSPDASLEGMVLALYYSKTIAATESFYGSLGYPVSSADDDATISKCDDHPVLWTSRDGLTGVRLRLRYSNKQAGDISYIHAHVEETPLFG